MSDGLRIVQPVAAEPDELWQACATPDGLQGWQADLVEGQVRPGARLRLMWPSLGAELELDVVEVQAPKRLVLMADRQRIIIEVQLDRVVLIHSGSTTEDEAAGTVSGWRTSLATLAHGLEYHRGLRRHVHWSTSVAAASPQLAHAYFTNGPALSVWLTSHGEIGDRNSPCRLGLRWGTSLTGQVLANTPGRDAAVSWQEQAHSVLALRTLPLPGACERRLIALQWSSWGEIDGRRATASHLDSCVRRLARAIEQRGSA